MLTVSVLFHRTLQGFSFSHQYMAAACNVPELNAWIVSRIQIFMYFANHFHTQ